MSLFLPRIPKAAHRGAAVEPSRWCVPVGGARKCMKAGNHRNQRLGRARAGITPRADNIRGNGVLAVKPLQKPGRSAPRVSGIQLPVGPTGPAA